MRKLVLALALTSAAFAGSTVYFARELSLERERAVAAPALAAAGAPSQAFAATPPAAGPASSQAGATTPDDRKFNVRFLSEPSANARAISEADIRKAQTEYSSKLLAQLADPEQREEMLAQHKMIVRMSSPRVDQVLGLSADEHAQLVGLLAQQQLDIQEASANCMADTTCELSELHRQNMDTRKREIDELLGPERAAKFETYKNTLGEREAVTQLRNRLPDVQRLSDANSELLIAALAEERDLMHREASQRGATVNGYSLGVGMVFAPGEGGTFEERYESARQSSQRLRDRAAQFLNAEQLRAFNEMQDETLISLRSVLRHKSSGTTSAMSLADPAN